MSHHFTTLEEGRLILLTQGADYSYKAEAHTVLETTLMLLDQAPAPALILIDARLQHSTSLEDVMAAGALVRSEEGKAAINHPKLLKIVLVTEDRAAKLTMKGINTATFGYVDIKVFSSLDEAVTYSTTLLGTSPQ